MAARLSTDQTPLADRSVTTYRGSSYWDEILDGRVWIIPDADITTVNATRATAATAAKARGLAVRTRRTNDGLEVQAVARDDATGGAPGEPDPPTPTRPLEGGDDDD